ncbi:MAG TPA: hypothetical protein VHA52_06830 [Candidatus Babeliaceae bacterium]|nr:hypothetical protein [Candidatus Babeliaceae bacterium]
MSGSSGNYSFDTGSSGPDCADLVLRTQLASPDPAVIADLGVGDILTVHLLNAVGPLQALTVDNQIAGAILTANPARLINCINSGYEFQARVLSINGGECQVSIYCANR